MDAGKRHLVVVMDHDGARLNNCRPARARLLLMSGRAMKIAGDPFTIQLLARENATQSNNEDGGIWKP